jgi:creatinine amidohydrolase/Fe(II)-dependent formamide hydrolase-like protein
MDSNDANKLIAALEKIDESLKAIVKQLAAINGHLGRALFLRL